MTEYRAGGVSEVHPPTIERAVEILTAASAARASRTDDQAAQLIAAAIDVALARLATVRARMDKLGEMARDVSVESHFPGLSNEILKLEAAWAERPSVEPATAIDFRATSPSYKLGPEWVGATRDDVFGPATPAPAAPPFDPVSDVRLREIANGVDIEIGPWAEAGDAERFAGELHMMAAELLAVRAGLARLHQDCQRWLTESNDRPNLRAAENRVRMLQHAAPPLVLVFDSREGRARGDITDVVASCDPATLVTIKDISLIDELPGISVGFVVNAAAVKALRERVQGQAAVTALAAAVEGAAQDAVDAGMLDPDWLPSR